MVVLWRQAAEAALDVDSGFSSDNHRVFHMPIRKPITYSVIIAIIGLSLTLLLLLTYQYKNKKNPNPYQKICEPVTLQKEQYYTVNSVEEKKGLIIRFDAADNKPDGNCVPSKVKLSLSPFNANNNSSKTESLKIGAGITYDVAGGRYEIYLLENEGDSARFLIMWERD